MLTGSLYREAYSLTSTNYRLIERGSVHAQLAAGVVAAHFHLSPTYIGQYFCRHTKQTLKAFIQKSRTRVIQLQLEFSDKTVSQLAFEYGYTDESHLIKAFRVELQEAPAFIPH